FSLQRGRSALTLGFEYRRNISNARTQGLESYALGGPSVFPDGLYFFDDLHSFGQEQPFAFSLGVNRFALEPLPWRALAQKYRLTESGDAVLDDLKLTRRL